MSSCLLALLVAVAWAVDFNVHAADRKPNIIHIVSDELAYFELSCLENPHLKTPNLDRMAAEGVRFTQALAGSAVCAPTRACLVTGMHSGHTSVRSNGGGTPLREGEQTIASVLKQAGYATGRFGKWGCGGRGSTGVPEKHGFDLFVGYYDQVHAHSCYPAYIVRNSAIQDCELFVSNTPDQFDQPVAKAPFQKTQNAQEVKCDPVRGRYVRLRALSEVNGGPWASVAELGVIGK